MSGTSDHCGNYGMFVVPRSTKNLGQVPPRFVTVLRSCGRFNKRPQRIYKTQTVMYVPPINGSEIRALNAPLQMNCVVLPYQWE